MRLINYRYICNNCLTFQDWHRELDSRLPGQFGDIGAWLHQAEGYLIDTNDVEAARQQIDHHQVMLHYHLIFQISEPRLYEKTCFCSKKFACYSFSVLLGC